ncbi:galactose mutarotase [Drosophila grimshawi]|uniref:Aldose 1-epimerase n=1 Tax=Drosophila grimshawi TaxID=7222 RepID=B4IZS5_DROGR|nr:galactose mutarotase [Drosophila grimshawi]EDV95660.1 GH15657 [Drosophila grimshawi]
MVKVTEDTFASGAVNPFTKQTEEIRRFTLSNDEQMSVQILTRGATISSIKVPDAQGQVEDVTLGFDNLAGYASEQNPYMGATVGRVCNRIANGRFVLDGKTIEVSRNRGEFQLHGGFIGFDKAHWDVVELLPNGVKMSHTNPDGHEGYPGEVRATATFILTEDNCLHVRMDAVTSKPTPVNLTNHSYFNLAGHKAGPNGIYEHTIQINAYGITETDANSIPTGKILPVDGGKFDLRVASNLGDRLKELQPALGYDDNFCVKFTPPASIANIARITHPPSGRWLEIASNQPGVQFYTSNFLPDKEGKRETPLAGKAGAAYIKHGAFCLETQKFPDSVNHENFPTSILRPGEKYHHEVIYKFGKQH